ncbi:2,3-dihydro-2,3-dihydroxybenzoate dehydrogenase [Streptomyces sp. 2224.1]|uniref:SDR family oxidoreductase n=1 Tax=unclassified Streptomyces TaxID=2593676 RepID=UPI000882F09E|nr:MULTISPECIES: SDR family oxidoreductase [unclassified Streptomyces]PBC84401.1 NAD(P)-dependent dehydrogenase (short-subunit alcohol dehydrogenase family) [Streptomyces sp. 2321.6]SDR31328.1 NAD(P)-dependent dehydrogenase, short-chain alcohol dehydrogenase family [Streptomyces sp. KS_16]SEB72789.1 2,3-dihydro-2,3-dihydroxybenzoate dehydrogenase [Streptomyces sp. 2224.1]SED30084.1 2,3-dihydro-2,3-dihydroxybenzoate dehydrogenase [Streptomyces sp. 2133.1]SNC70484.1 NAD(P)-dependent dehydrogenas
MQGRTVLVTGATRGIGLAVSHRLAAGGARVLGIARSAPQTEFPGLLTPCDLADGEQTREVMRSLARDHQVHAVVNNVGIALPEPLDDVSTTSLQMAFDLNVRAAMQVVQACVGGMREQGRGRIVNVASRAVFGARGRSSYSAAKSALVGLTRTWALELAEHAITVNAVAPGPVDTELFHRTRPVGSEAEARVLQTIPMGRLGRPEEIAAAICFLLGDDAGFITGQTLCVDGGGSIAGR